MLRVKLNEATNLQFDMIIEGNAKSIDKTWIVLESTGYELRFPAVYADGTVTCSIPALAGTLANGKTMAHLEVVIDGRYYRPMSESIMVGSGKQDISIIAREAASTFDESYAALKKIAPAATGLNTSDTAELGKQLDEKIAEERAAHERRLAEARKIADALINGINTDAAVVVDDLALLRSRILPKQ
jgi:hypothetical protein